MRELREKKNKDLEPQGTSRKRGNCEGRGSCLVGYKLRHEQIGGYPRKRRQEKRGGKIGSIRREKELSKETGGE